VRVIILTKSNCLWCLSCSWVALLYRVFFFFVGMILLSPAAFAVPYTFGNIFALASTFFLMGPLRQLKMMIDPNRIVSAIIYVVAMALTLYFAFGLQSAILVIIAVIVQFCALIWYGLSYIPFARQCICNLCRGAVVE